MPRDTKTMQPAKSWRRSLGIGAEQDFDATILDALTPEAVLRLDVIADRLLELGRTDDAIRAIRSALIKPVQ